MEYKSNHRYQNKRKFYFIAPLLVVLLAVFVASLLVPNHYVIKILVLCEMVWWCSAIIGTMNDDYFKENKDSAEYIDLSKDELEYVQLAKVTAWCYGIASLSILFLPFLERVDGSAVWAFNCNPPVPLLFSGFSCVVFLDFYGHLNQRLNQRSRVDEWETFNVLPPFALIVVAILFFLIGDRYVGAFMQDGMFFHHSWSVSSLHYMGLFVYCICLSIAIFCTIKLNKIVSNNNNKK